MEGAPQHQRLRHLAQQLRSSSAAAASAAEPTYGGRDYTALDEPSLAPAGLLKVHSLNHVSKESADVPRLVEFYSHFLGFTPLARPLFRDAQGTPFGGAWLFLPPSTAMHLIATDPEHSLPEAPIAEVAGPDPQRESYDVSDPSNTPDARFHPVGISRGHHYAFRVTDIKAAEQRLIEAGIVFQKITSPPNFLLTAEGEKVKATEDAEPVSQIFFFDPDGNGVEIGNFAPIQPGFAPPLKGVLPPVLVTSGPERPLSSVPPLISVHSLNHCARETPNVERIARWYIELLGFRRLDRPAIQVSILKNHEF